MQDETINRVLPDFRSLPITQLVESSTNPRRTFDPAKKKEPAASIRAQGILVPLIIRKLPSEQYEVIAGARRFRAAQLAGLEDVPVRIVVLDDAQHLEFQLIENAQREDVHPYEEAAAYKALLEMTSPQFDVSAIASRVGKSIGHIYARLKLADLIPEASGASLVTRSRPDTRY